jgi:hypothetical protein
VFSVFVIFFLGICASAQQAIRQPLITQRIDESRVVTLKGNTHPLAQPRFDMGAAPPDLPMDRMLLVLNRDPQQDFTLHRLLDDQQDKNSPNYHEWLHAFVLESDRELSVWVRTIVPGFRVGTFNHILLCGDGHQRFCLLRSVEPGLGDYLST